MFGLPTWLLIFPVLGFLIFIHELGHFATAKWFGIKVTEFGFGFPPRIFGVRFKGTLYSVNWIPLGGFVRMVGEEDPSDPESFARQSVAKRSIVLVAGSFMNLVLPIVILTVIFMLPHDSLLGSDVVIVGLVPGSPAHEAGLRSGDTILRINSHLVTDPSDAVEQIRANLGQPTNLTVRRSAAVAGVTASPELAAIDTVTLVPRVDPPRQKVVAVVTDPTASTVAGPARGALTLNPDGAFSYEREGGEAAIYTFSDTQISPEAARAYDPDLQVGDTVTQGAIGVSIGLARPRYGRSTDPIWRAVPRSITTMWNIMVFTWNGLAEGISTRSNPGIVGPIGIAQATGEGVSRLGFAWIFQLTAFLSLNLGIVNILPIPALDGGRLTFVLIEWVRRGRRISPKREGLVHLVGFALVIGLILVLSYSDVARIFSGESLF